MTQLSANIPPAADAIPGKRLSVWTTLAWSLVVVLFWVAGQFSFAMLYCQGSLQRVREPQWFNEASAWFGLFWAIFLALLFWAVLRWHKCGDYSAYFGFSRPAGKELLRGCGMLALIEGFWEVLFHLRGIPTITQWQIDFFRCFHGWWYVPVVLMIVCAAPFWEELLFRGFLFRGWSAGRTLGAVAGGVVIPAVLWALLHYGQYAWYYLLPILSLGLLFGFLRRAGYSLWTCIALHALNNAVSCVATFYALPQG